MVYCFTNPQFKKDHINFWYNMSHVFVTYMGQAGVAYNASTFWLLWWSWAPEAENKDYEIIAITWHRLLRHVKSTVNYNWNNICNIIRMKGSLTIKKLLWNIKWRFILMFSQRELSNIYFNHQDTNMIEIKT